MVQNPVQEIRRHVTYLLLRMSESNLLSIVTYMTFVLLQQSAVSGVSGESEQYTYRLLSEDRKNIQVDPVLRTHYISDELGTP